MKVVIDSNILLVAISKKSAYRPIWNAFIAEQYQLIICDEVLYEYEEILQLRSAPGAASLVLEILIEAPNVIFQNIYYNWNAVKSDPDDNKFFDIAIAANADYLVTNDSHFNSVKTQLFPSVKIISADEFLHLI